MKSLAKGFTFLNFTAGKFPLKGSVRIFSCPLTHAKNPLVSINNYGTNHIVMLHSWF